MHSNGGGNEVQYVQQVQAAQWLFSPPIVSQIFVLLTTPHTTSRRNYLAECCHVGLLQTVQCCLMPAHAALTSPRLAMSFWPSPTEEELPKEPLAQSNGCCCSFWDGAH